MKIKNRLKDKSGIGKWVYFHDKDHKNYWYRGLCVDEAVEISNDYAHRLQKIIWCQDYNNRKKKWVNLKDKDFEISLRSCYWVIDKKRKKIVFGQFCMNGQPQVVRKIFKKAHIQGFFKSKSHKQAKRDLIIFLRNNPKKAPKSLKITK